MIATSEKSEANFDITDFIDFEGGEKAYQRKLKTEIIDLEKEKFAHNQEIEELKNKKKLQRKELKSLKQQQQTSITQNSQFGYIYEDNSLPMLLMTCGDGYGGLLSWNK